MGTDDEAWNRAHGDFFGAGGAAGAGARGAPGAGGSSSAGGSSFGGPAGSGQQLGSDSAFGAGFGADSRFGSGGTGGTGAAGGSVPFGTPTGPGPIGPAVGTSRGRRRPGPGRYLRYAVLGLVAFGLVLVANDYRQAWQAYSATDVSFPQEAIGLQLVDSPEALALAKQLQENAPGELGSGRVKTAFYGRTNGALAVVAYAQRKSIPLVPFGLRDAPDTSVDMLTRVATAGNAPVSPLTRLDPGRLGGRLVCLSVQVTAAPQARLCAGDTATSVVTLAFVGATAPDADVQALREAIVTMK